MIAGTRKRGPELRHRPKGDAESRSRAPRGATAGDPAVISGDPEMGVTARHATGAAASAPAPVGALLPSIFLGAETGKGHPPPPIGPAKRWLFDNQIKALRESFHGAVGADG